MIVVVYDAYFQKLSTYAISIQSVEYERVHFFARKLRHPFIMSTHILVVIGLSFNKVSSHAQVMKEMHHRAQKESNKRP